MSEEQRSSRASSVIEVLATEPIDIKGRIVDSSNSALLVELESGMLAIYKPESFERPLRDFPPGLHRRELAAYIVAKELGLDLLPEVVIRTDLPFGVGSLQRFINADFEIHYYHLLQEQRHLDDLSVLAYFDMIINNTDRKAGHVLIDQDDHLWAIDNALTFHRFPKLRTVIWELGGSTIAPQLRERVARLAVSPPPELEDLLLPEELRALSLRCQKLAKLETLPLVDEEMRGYPWPLI